MTPVRRRRHPSMLRTIVLIGACERCGGSLTERAIAGRMICLMCARELGDPLSVLPALPWVPGYLLPVWPYGWRAARDPEAVRP